ncbi:MAG: WbqC family protein [Actinomycetota bacterium]
MRRCVISQPRLFPGLHYLHRMLVADVFVVFDSVQFNPRHEENRAKVKTADGPKWLTVPMQKISRDQLICDTRIADQPWQEKSIRMLENLYGKSPHFDDNIERITAIINGDHKTLTDLDVASWQPALQDLAPHAEFVMATDLDVDGAGSELLLNICETLDADAYLSGEFGRTYLDVDAFNERGIGVEYHQYTYPEYPQRYGPFEPYLSYLDMLFNVGLDRERVLNEFDNDRGNR